MPAKIRAESSDAQGKFRQKRYQKALEHRKKAMENGFYLEAIAISESMICDRLESYRSRKTGTQVDFSTIERNVKEINKLISQAEQNEKDGEEDSKDKKYMGSIVAEIKNWADKRNTALHECVKLQDLASLSWEDFIIQSRSAAEEGEKLFRELDKQYQKWKRAVYMEGS